MVAMTQFRPTGKRILNTFFFFCVVASDCYIIKVYYRSDGKLWGHVFKACFVIYLIGFLTWFLYIKWSRQFQVATDYFYLIFRASMVLLQVLKHAYFTWETHYRFRHWTLWEKIINTPDWLDTFLLLHQSEPVA